MSLHLGHHFFGAGNLGDDFMLSGFLRTLPDRWRGRLTCCVPHDRTALAARFPEVTWLPYAPEARRTAIESSSAWLGLGGSPFQSAVSRWFIDHLAEEARLCAGAGKPMYFLGVGVQDEPSVYLPEVQIVLRQAARIWTRDSASAQRLAEAVPGLPVTASADLAHILFAENPPPQAARSRLAAVLNFDYADWPGLPPLLREAEALPVRERVWVAQESRELPGAERLLHARLPEAERSHWRLRVVESLAEWPTAEWQLSSRYHATLVAAYAGSRAIVVGTNSKLRAVADETGFPLIAPNDSVPHLAPLWERASAPSGAHLQSRARLAAQACAEFFAAVG